jgi:hypothetical protein
VKLQKMHLFRVKRRSFRISRKTLIVMLGCMSLAFCLGVYLLNVDNADAAIAPDSRFTRILPAYSDSTQAANTYLEIAQVGEGNTLDAQESWSKVYFEPNKVSDGTIGVYRGGYGGAVDSSGLSNAGQGNRFSDANAVRYDFYLGVKRQDPESGFSDEVPCTVEGSFAPSLTVFSGEMSVDGWYKIAADRFVKNARCNGAEWSQTIKTGKFVLFIRTSWATSAPVVSGKKQGRVNAYKVGAAYATKDGNPLTGYWSNPGAARQPTRPLIAGYSIQDRISPNNTNGNYTFKFAPDCRIPRGSTDKRYLHWRDVDYPAYYQSPWPVQPAPDFRLFQISPSGSRTEVAIPSASKKFNGTGQNVHGSVEIEFKGGYKYEWVWTNVARIDGVSFWLPYDDYPSIVGCGSYEQTVGLWGSRGAGWSQGNFEATGGDTLQFLVDESYVKGTSAAPDTTSNAYLRSPNGALYANTFADPGGATGISDNGRRVGRAQVQWTLPGMGPSSPYTNRRWLLFNYQIKSDAQNGAIHCFNADMTPKSNTDPLGIVTSNTICVTINNSLKPFLSTSGGDVHAGNDCIVQTIGNGKITGPPVNGLNIGSSGSYIVSAGDRITDFGSGNSPNSSALTFGRTGYYGSICRPRLSEADVDKAIAAGAVEVPFSGMTFNASAINGLSDSKKYVVKLPAGTSVSGVFTRSVTLYSKGNINIVGDLRGDTVGRYAKNKLPVVGVVAEGDIAISPGVTRIDALLYALDTIDTCSGQNIATPGGVTACKPALTLNGFAMAGNFSFKRTTGTAGLTRAENVIFNAAFYLNPPPVLGTAAGTVKYLGERAPLY